MASSASALLKVELQANGENDSTWGTKANEVFKRLEQAIAGEHAVALTSSDVTLDDTVYDASGTAESHKMHLDCAGTLTTNVNVIVPARTKLYIVTNGTSGAYTVTVKTSAGSGIAVTQGKKALLWCDGTNVEKILATDDFEVVDDTSPQLGGFLDPNSNYIGKAKGGDIASAAPLVIDTDGDYFDITGTTGFSAMTVAANRSFVLQFDGACVITVGAGITLNNSGANYTTSVGDILVCQSTVANTVVGWVIRADGQAVVRGIEGTAVASAATADIWANDDGDTVHITGTTTITSFGTAPRAGTWRKVIFDGVLTLTHGANLNLPGSVNITTAANDFAFVYADTTTLFRVVYFKADGSAVIGVFTESFESAEQTITAAGSLTLAHSLSSTPTLVQVYLICKTADLNYSVDDVLYYGVMEGNTASRGVSIVPDATNLNCRYGSAATVFTGLNKTSGVGGGLANGSWKMIVRAWA